MTATFVASFVQGLLIAGIALVTARLVVWLSRRDGGQR